MKVFVTGVGGQLGHDMMLEAAKRGHQVIGSDLHPAFSGVPDSAVRHMPYISLDITDAQAVSRVLRQEKPDVVVHCAAWTAVDLAEETDKIAIVNRINAEGTRNVARACNALGCKMVYISTDYVFSGLGEEPWEPECVEFAPVNVYGRSKLAGEQAVAECMKRFFIVRIAWAFGRNGKNFVKTMLALSEKYDTLRVVCDQIGTPTYTKDLAVLLADMIETEKYGYYHVTNEGGYISWYEFACEIFRQAGRETHVIPVTTQEYGLSKAARPLNSRMGKKKLAQEGFQPLPHWQDALRRYLKEIEV